MTDRADTGGFERHYTPEEAAAILRLSKRHIYRLIHAGRIVALKSGHKWIIPQSAVQAYIARATYGTWE